MAYAAAGKTTEAEEITGGLERLQGKRYVLPYNIAKIYAVAAAKDKTFAWLEKAYEEGNPDLIELNSEPVFDRLRSEARFSDLMRLIGFQMSGT